jgi:hypothetical protein
MTSESFFREWSQTSTTTDVFGRTVSIGRQIAFAYIDGAHTYTAAKSDVDNVDAFLMPGGFVLFDDSAEDSGFQEVTRVATEVARLPQYELVFAKPNYFFKKRR